MINTTSSQLRVVFMGTPEFAVPSLEALLADDRYDVVGVFTQPPRPAHRGQKVQRSPIHVLAEKQNLPVFTPEKLTEAKAFEDFKALRPDVCVVVAYGAILRERYLELPKHGCINVHGSLLPRWRGASPIFAALAHGDTETGVTIMEMVRDLDAGAMIAKASVPIGPDTTAGDLHDELCKIGARLLVGSLADYCSGFIKAEPQDDARATFCGKITREHARIDWTEPMQEIDQLIRACNPWPGAWFVYRGEPIKVFKAKVVESFDVGVTEISPDGTMIQGVDGALKLELVQRPGKKPQPIAEFLRGFDFSAGNPLM